MLSFFGFSVSLLYMVPHFLQVSLFDKRFIMMSSGTFRFMTRSIFDIFSRAFACFMVLGKPSRMQPFLQSGFLNLFARILIIISSGPSLPLSLYSFIRLPSFVCAFISSRTMSPLDMCGSLRVGVSLEA